MNQLTEQELRALRSMDAFKTALSIIQSSDALEARRVQTAREARKNSDGTWKHDDPKANPHREDGLYGKAAQAADGDWYGSH